MKRTFLILALSAFVIIYCCGDDDKPTGGNGNNPTTDTNILKTDEFGNILGGDTTDWCYHNPGGFQFKPAYPNPTQGNVVNISFECPVSDSVKIYILKSSTDTTFFVNQQLQYGFYTVMINDSTGQYTNTFQRIYMSVKNYTPPEFCRFYGDIHFEQ